MSIQFAQALKNEQPFAIFAKQYLDDEMSDLEHSTQAELEQTEKDHEVIITEELVNFTDDDMDYLQSVDSVIMSFSKDQVIALKKAIKLRLSVYLGINNAQELNDRSKKMAELFKEHYSNFSNVRLTGLDNFDLNETVYNSGYRLNPFGTIEMYPSYVHDETVFTFNFGIRDRDLPFKASVSLMLSSACLQDYLY